MKAGPYYGEDGDVEIIVGRVVVMGGPIMPEHVSFDVDCYRHPVENVAGSGLRVNLTAKKARKLARQLKRAAYVLDEITGGEGGPA